MYKLKLTFHLIFFNVIAMFLSFLFILIAVIDNNLVLLTIFDNFFFRYDLHQVKLLKPVFKVFYKFFIFTLLFI